MTPLRQRLIDYLRQRNFTPSTIKSYVSAVKLFAIWLGRSPEHCDMEDVRRYYLHLIERKLSNSTITTAQSAIRTLFVEVLNREWDERLSPPLAQRVPIIPPNNTFPHPTKANPKAARERL